MSQASLKRIDYQVCAGYTAYAVTLNPPSPWDQTELEFVLNWHRSADHAILIMEKCQDGSDHYHSMVYLKIANTGGVTRSLERMLSKNSLNWHKHVTIKVKKADAGWFTYILKHQDAGAVPLHLHGWEMCWIRELVKQRVKDSVSKKVDTAERTLGNHNATRVIMDYAEACAMPLLSKMDLSLCCAQMMSEKYKFTKVSFPQVWAEVSARLGNKQVAVDWILDQLQFLHD